MKVLVVGLGSMGKRRIGNLRKQAVPIDIHAFDPRADRREHAKTNLGVTVHGSLAEALAIKPEAAIISTPPSQHVPVMKTLVEARVPFMVEASVIDDGLQEIIDGARKANLVALPSCTMRFHSSIRAIRRLLHEEKILGDLSTCAFTYHMGQYLPDWHPHESINDYYVGTRETSGSREMICFENVWLTYLFGMPTKVACFADKKTKMPANIEDVFQLIARYESGATGSMLIDVVSRHPYRQLRIISEDGVIEWSAVDNVLRTFSAKTKTWTDVNKTQEQNYRGGNFTGEDMYVDEVAGLLATVAGKKDAFPFTLEEDRLVLSLLRRALVSEEKGAVLPVGRELIDQL